MLVFRVSRAGLANFQPKLSRKLFHADPRLKPEVLLRPEVVALFRRPAGVSRLFSSKTSLADEILSQKKAEQERADSSEQKGDGGGADSSKPKYKPLTKWQKIGYTFFGVVFTGSLVANCIIFSLPDRDENGNYIDDEFSALPARQQYYRRLKSKFFQTKKELEDPFSDKLLPDPLPEPYIQPKYTVLVELTGLLVHATWSHKHGWRFQKRPAVDMFLSQIGYPNFELVVYTVETPMTFFPIVDGLDPQNQHIIYRLFRDATKYINGHHTKDVSALNRDPKRVIIVDWNKDSVALGMDNSLLLEKWDGDTSDRKLIGLAQLLQAIKQSDVDDVRDVLSYYRQFDDPIQVFRENQRKLQEEMSDENLKKKPTEPKPLMSGFSFMRKKATG